MSRANSCECNRGGLTIIDLLQGNLGVMWQCLLSFGAQHERLRFLWCSHCACL